MWVGGPPKPTQPMRPHSRSTVACSAVIDQPIFGRVGLRHSDARDEQFDRVAGGVFQEDLLTARAGDDVVAERDAGGAQPGDLGGEVGHDEVDAVPAARDRAPRRRAWAGRRSWPAR